MKKAKKNSIFDFKTYRSFLKDWIETQEQSRGLMRKLAVAARCETSHISRVLSDQLELTPDQAFRIAQFIRLSEVERTYFLKLVDYERAGDADFRKHLHAELNVMIQNHQNLAQRFQDTAVMMNGQEMLYYSSWHWSAIHIAVSIPELQTPKALAQKLGLSESFVLHTLQALQGFDLVKNENGLWKMTNKHIHLSKNSPMNSVQHSNWRQRAILRTQDPEETGLHYTVVQSLSRQDYEKLKQQFLNSLDDYRAVANPSKEEELICLTLDFFKV